MKHIWITTTHGRGTTTTTLVDIQLALSTLQALANRDDSSAIWTPPFRSDRIGGQPHHDNGMVSDNYSLSLV